MSATIPSPSSSARRKVASTTYVAPCRRCAGPNTSPRRLWAIIMWSRTVTLNMRWSPNDLLTGTGSEVCDPEEQFGPGEISQRVLHGDANRLPRTAHDLLL